MSVIVTVPDLVPVVVGLKVTLMVQEELAPTLEPQVLVWEKSPLIVMLLIVRVALPVFVSVTFCGLLLLPSACDANVNEVGDTLAPGTAPVPERLAV